MSFGSGNREAGVPARLRQGGCCPPGGVTAAVALLTAFGSLLCVAACTLVTDFTPSARIDAGDADTADGDRAPDAEDCEPTIDGIPGAQERCNGFDDDCDGEVDEELDDCDPVVQLAAKLVQACVLRASGRVQCWGSNADGNLGRPADRLVDVGEVRGLDDAIHIALGAAHSCAVRRGGEVSCWGSNTEWQLGNDRPIGSDMPIDVNGVTTARSVAAGGGFTCVLKSDGGVLCWGNNDAGQLGRPGEGSPEPQPVPGITDAVELVAGARHACVRLGGGEVSCWGCGMAQEVESCVDAGAAEPVEMAGVRDAAGLAAGRRHSCAHLTDGGLMCWGENLAGQLGIDSFEHGALPQPVPLSRWLESGSIAQVASGGEWEEVLPGEPGHGGTTCILLRSGEAYCWGANDVGQLGLGSFRLERVRHLTDRVTGLQEFVAVAAGQVYTCGLELDGTVWCWGLGLVHAGISADPRQVQGL